MRGILTRFERSLERAVEGSSARVFRSSLQPAEIARKLEREMVARQWIGVSGKLVPNQYTVRLGNADHARFATSIAALEAELTSWLSESASRRGFSTIGGLEVSVVEDVSFGPRQVTIEANHSGTALTMARAAPSHPTEELQMRRSDSPRQLLVLRVLTAGAGIIDHPIRKTVSTVGRALENDIVLDYPEISRFHARLEFTAGALAVSDLGSTNGTWVNGYRADGRVQVFNGDSVTFGTTNCQIVSAS